MDSFVVGVVTWQGWCGLKLDMFCGILLGLVELGDVAESAGLCLRLRFKGISVKKIWIQYFTK